MNIEQTSYIFIFLTLFSHFSHTFLALFLTFSLLFFLQINTAVQQPGFRRVKRGLRPQVPAIHGLHYAATLGESNSIDVEPTDPYFPMQWYLKNTGQNGGKVRLDLNVQAAWAQGITGKNVTTAIMDDGRCNQCSQL